MHLLFWCWSSGQVHERSHAMHEPFGAVSATDTASAPTVVKAMAPRAVRKARGLIPALSACALGAVLATVGRAFALSTGRRSALLGGALAPLAPPAAWAEENPLPPPVVKDLERAAPKIQAGVDWFYFELLPGIEKEDLGQCRKALGSTAEGSYVSPLDSEITFPFNQLASANIEADEDGWTEDIRNFQKAVTAMSDSVGTNEWKTVKAEWNKAKDALNHVMGNINQRAEGGAPFQLMDDSYADRGSAYLQAKKDMMKFRNQAGTLALR